MSESPFTLTAQCEVRESHQRGLYDTHVEAARDAHPACPGCGTSMVKEYGPGTAIAEPRTLHLLEWEPQIVHRPQPGAFWSCYACGHCEAV